MQGYVRNKTRTEAQKPLKLRQTKWDGGENSDTAASTIGPNQCALLENVICFPDRLEGRSGTRGFSATTLPGSGTIHSAFQHPTTKKFILHRGSGLHVADSAMASWTTVTEYHHGSGILTEAGDASNQLSANVFWGLNSGNSDAGVLYWNLTNSVSTRTLNLYSDSGKTTLVASGSRTGDGVMNILPSANSGIAGVITVTYSGDDTTAGNTFTGSIGSGVGINVASVIKAFNNDALVFMENGSIQGVIYVDLTNTKFYALNADTPDQVIAGSGAQAAASPYGYRYLYTFSRITNGSGVASYSSNRITGTLVQETGSVDTTSTDYGEFWVANQISGSNANSLTFNVFQSIVPGDGLSSGATHVSLYRTMDIGANGMDPVTGQGNNRELYTWIGDYAIGSGTISDTTTDDVLRSRFASGFGLASRFFKPLFDGGVGEVTNSFIFVGARSGTRVQYSQLVKKELAGQHRRDVQFFKLDDGIQILAQSPDILSLICNNKTYTSAYGNTQDVDAIASVFTITHLTIANQNIGVTDYSSFVETKNGIFMAVCSDRTVRQWNRFIWSDDLSLNGVNKVVQVMITGSTACYTAGAYYLWYRTSASPSYNSSCLRLGLGGNAGNGWTRMTGSAWVYPTLYTGAILIQDSSSVQKMLVLDDTAGLFYWAPPFMGYALSLTNGYFLDKIATNGTGGTGIACKVRFRELTGDVENERLFHEESFMAFRDWTGAGGVYAGTVTYYAYVDANTTTAADSIAYTQPASVQFFKKVTSPRLQFEAQMTIGATTGFQLVTWAIQCQRHEALYVGHTSADSTEATNQLNLATSLKHWLCQPQALLNRATGTNYTLAGTAPTQVTGPNGKSYALSFISGASYTQADTTSYTSFAICCWVKTVDLNVRLFNINGTSDFYARFTSNTALDVNGVTTLTVTTIASGWHNFWFVRSGSTVTVYQAGVANGTTVTVAGAVGGTNLQINDQGGAMLIDDLRVYNTTLTAADIAYYYNDIVNNAGKKVLPLA